MEVLKGLSKRWRDIGSDLFVHKAALNVIENDILGDLERVRSVVLYWILKCPYASWRFLIYRLDDSNHRAFNLMADNCRKFAGKITGTCGVTRVRKTND